MATCSHYVIRRDMPSPFLLVSRERVHDRPGPLTARSNALRAPRAARLRRRALDAPPRRLDAPIRRSADDRQPARLARRRSTSSRRSCRACARLPTRSARDGFTDIVLLGMGGSSLAPEVLRQVLGVADRFPRFRMLDSVDPDAVRDAMAHAATSLFVIASKSGSTIEPNVDGGRSAAPRQRSRACRLGHALRRHHRRRHALHRRATAERIPRHLRQPVRHRRPLLGALVLRHGAGGADGHRPRRAARRRARDGDGLPSHERARRIPAWRSARSWRPGAEPAATS